MPEPEQTEIVIDPPPFEIDPPPFPVMVPSSAPTPADIAALEQWLIAKKAELTARIVTIESMLGFIATSDDLAVRVAKIELFLGITPG